MYINKCMFKNKSSKDITKSSKWLGGIAKSDITDANLTSLVQLSGHQLVNSGPAVRLSARLKVIQIFQEQIEELLHSHESLDAHGVNELFAALQLL